MGFCSKQKCWSMQASINRQFSVLGGIIARRPLLFLIIAVFVTAILSTGFFFMAINRDNDWLYTDSNRRAAKSKRLVERLFPFNTSIYNDVYRRTSMYEFTAFLIVAKDGQSILREEVIKEVMSVDNILRKTEVEWKGRIANYSILCGKTLGKCIDTGLTEIVSNFQKIREGKYKIKYPFSIDNVTFYHKEYASLLGGVELDNEGYVKDVKALMVSYLFDFSDPSKLEAIDKWEEIIYDYFAKKDYKYIDYAIMNRESSERSAEMLTNKIFKVTPIIFGTILLFSALSCMTDKWATSKPFLGMSACISAILAIASGFGFGFLVGIQYQDSYMLLAYIVLAIEVDDGFMLIASWKNTSLRDSVPKRMEQTFHHTAASITITSTTNILSCVIGMATTSIPAFKMLCAMAFICSLFAYIYQLIVFGACLALSGYSEQDNAHLFVCSKIRKRTESSSREDKGDIFMLLFRNTIGNFLKYPIIKAIVIAAFFANLGISLWGWMYVKYGVGMDNVLPANTHLSTFFKMKYEYFDRYTTPVHVIIKDTLNYADLKVQLSIETLARELESHPHLAESSNRISWLNYYTYSMHIPFAKVLYYGYNMSDKQDFIDGLRHVFLRNRNAMQFNFDIAFNENYTEIVASRFLIGMKNINSTDAEVKTIKKLYEIVAKTDLPVEIFGMTFHVLEQTWTVKSIAIQIAFLSIGLSCLVFFGFSHNIRASLCVTFTVLCIVCEVVGYFSLWGVGIDLASLAVFTVSVGYSINYPAHMAYVFVEDTELDPEERVKDALYRIGTPMTQGALSTILGLFMLLFQQLYVMEATFKVLCLIALLSLFHSLLVIPVILDLAKLLRKPESKIDAGKPFIRLFRSRKEVDRSNIEVVSP